MDSSDRNMKSWKDGTNVKWDVRVRIGLNWHGIPSKAGSNDPGNGLSSFVNNSGYSISNRAMHQLFIDFKKACDSFGNEVLYCNIHIECNIHMKQIR